jgi:hypothetical protein
MSRRHGGRSGGGGGLRAESRVPPGSAGSTMFADGSYGFWKDPMGFVERKVIEHGCPVFQCRVLNQKTIVRSSCHRQTPTRPQPYLSHHRPHRLQTLTSAVCKHRRSHLLALIQHPGVNEPTATNTRTCAGCTAACCVSLPCMAREGPGPETSRHLVCAGTECWECSYCVCSCSFFLFCNALSLARSQTPEHSCALLTTSTFWCVLYSCTAVQKRRTRTR